MPKRWLMSLAVVVVAAHAAWAQSPGERADRIARNARQFPHNKPALGEAAPTFVLQDLDGREVRLRDLIGPRPIVIEFGSYT
jgi:hypothetical protein